MRATKFTLPGRLLSLMGKLSSIALYIMMLVTVVDVFMANVLHRPIVGAFDLVSTALVFAVFLGIPIMFYRDTHIVVDVIDHFVSPSVVAKLRVLARIVAVAFLLVLLYNMIEPATDAYKYGEIKQELGLPLYWIWLPMLIGVVTSVVAVVVRQWEGNVQAKEH